MPGPVSPARPEGFPSGLSLFPIPKIFKANPKVKVKESLEVADN
jgi:hypothetical protein